VKSLVCREVGEDLGVTREMMAGADEGFLVNRGGDGCVDLAGEGKIDKRCDGAEGGFASGGGNFADAQIAEIDAGEGQYIHCRRVEKRL
jgi:hypothetical protein